MNGIYILKAINEGKRIGSGDSLAFGLNFHVRPKNGTNGWLLVTALS